MMELANILGCTQSTVSQWESGFSEPGPKYMRKLKNLFGDKFIIDNIDIIDKPVSDIPEDYLKNEEGKLNTVIKNLTDSNRLIAESNKVLSESNKVLSESIQKAMDIHEKVMEQLLHMEHEK